MHVWAAVLEEAPVTRLRTLLSKEEIIRADRFYSKVDGGHFTASRGYLRAILGHYLNEEAKALEFGYGSHGKPNLIGNNEEKLEFNLTHSNGLALYAVSLNRPLGIDVEHIGREVAHEQVARRFFSDKEVDALLSLPENKRRDGFFHCWTRKEAFIKAIGMGLSFSLKDFDVTVKGPAQLLAVRSDSEEASRWQLKAVRPAEDYVGALSVSGSDWSLERWQIPKAFGLDFV